MAVKAQKSWARTSLCLAISALTSVLLGVVPSHADEDCLPGFHVNRTLGCDPDPKPVPVPPPPRLVPNVAGNLRIDPPQLLEGEAWVTLTPAPEGGYLLPRRLRGSHRFRFIAPGYAPEEQNIELGQPIVTPPVALLHWPNLTIVTDDGEPATAYLDGKPLNELPLKEFSLPAGITTELYTLVVKRDHYRPFSTTLDLRCPKPGASPCWAPTIELTAHLEPLPGHIRMTKDVAPGGLFDVIVELVASGDAAPLLSSPYPPPDTDEFDVAPGTHTLRIVAKPTSALVSTIDVDVHADEVVDFAPTYWTVRGFSALSSWSSFHPSQAANFDDAAKQCDWFGEAKACAQQGHLIAHGLVPGKTPNDAMKRYVRACRIGGKEGAAGCLGAAWLLRSKSVPVRWRGADWIHFADAACKEDSADCWYKYTVADDFDPTEPEAISPSSSLIGRGYVYTSLGYWPLASRPLYLPDIGGELSVGTSGLQGYAGIALREMVVRQTDASTGDSSHTYHFGISVGGGVLLQARFPRWSLGVRSGVQYSAYTNELLNVLGFVETVRVGYEDWNIEAGVIYEQLPLRVDTVNPFGDSVTINSRDYSWIVLIRFGHQWLF